MSKEEVNELLGLLKANYGYAFKELSAGQKRLLVESWAICLADVDAKLAMIAVIQFIASSKWMPTVAEIREKVCENHYEARSGLMVQDAFAESNLPTDQKRIDAYGDMVRRGNAIFRHDPNLTIEQLIGISNLGDYNINMLDDGAMLQLESGETKEEHE